MVRRIVALLGFAAAGFLQSVSASVVPTATLFPVASADQVDRVTLSALDLARIGIEDLARAAAFEAPRFAIPTVVSMTPSNSGTWEDLPNGQRLWRLRIVAAKGTTSLNLGFRRFLLSEGDRLLVHSTDLKQAIRPFTAEDNEDHGELWTPVLPTTDMMVELTVSANSSHELELGSVNQGYRGFGTTPADSYVKSGSCNLDVECLDAGDPWRETMQSVAVLTIDGSLNCTGSLLNNTSADQRMFLITANHCGVGAGNAPSTIAHWNYQNSFCRTPGSVASGQTGDGVITQFHSGSIHRASSAASDVTLVELDDPPVPAFNHFWAGWDRISTDIACSAGSPCGAIHHPSTDEKRITYSTANIVSSSWATTPPPSPGDGTHIWVHWATDPPGPFTVPGVTEPGSSGSPLYSPQRRFIGQLHGGASACGATGDNLSDIYGRFNISWTGGGTNSTRLSNWLDPGNTGATTLDGIGPCTPPGAPSIGTATATGPNQIQITFADGAPPSTTYNVYRALGTCASPGTFVEIASGIAGSPYDDNAVSGGTTYAFRVTGVDSTGGCESPPSSCVQATATGACTLPPTFAGLAAATNDAASTCGVGLSWAAATANCGGPVSYTIHRSTTPGFTPSGANQIATGETGTAYADSGTLTSGTTYYYVVRATDGTNSVTDGNTVERSTAPTGPIATGTLTETFEGAGGFDNPGWTHAVQSGANDWVLSTTQSQTPTHSWFSDSEPGTSHRSLVSPSFVPQAGSTLSFWHTFDFEGTSTCFDGGTLESSTDGSTWTVVPDAAFTAGGFNGTVSTAHSNPIGGLRAWCNGTIGPMTQVSVNLGAFASVGTQLRWHAGDDVSLADVGWFVDSVTLSNVGTAGSCQTTGGPAPVGAEFFTLTPCRLIDTREPNGPLGGPAIAAGQSRDFSLTGTCGIPSGVRSVVVNVTVVAPTASGFLQAYAPDQPTPPTAVINFGTGTTRANNGVFPLDASGAVRIGNGSASPVEVVLDVSGYFD